MGFRTIHKHLPVAPSLRGFLLLIAFVQHSIELFTLHHQQCHEGSSYRVSLGVTQWVPVFIPNPPLLMILAQCALGCHGLTVREEEEFPPEHIGILESRLTLGYCPTLSPPPALDVSTNGFLMYPDCTLICVGSVLTPPSAGVSLVS